jgi:hypothetical protein
MENLFRRWAEWKYFKNQTIASCSKMITHGMLFGVFHNWGVFHNFWRCFINFCSYSISFPKRERDWFLLTLGFVSEWKNFLLSWVLLVSSLAEYLNGLHLSRSKKIMIHIDFNILLFTIFQSQSRHYLSSSNVNGQSTVWFVLGLLLLTNFAWRGIFFGAYKKDNNFQCYVTRGFDGYNGTLMHLSFPSVTVAQLFDWNFASITRERFSLVVDSTKHRRIPQDPPVFSCSNTFQ